MNRSTLSLSISKAIDGFLKFKIAGGLSQRTVDSYELPAPRLAHTVPVPTCWSHRWLPTPIGPGLALLHRPTTHPIAHA